MWDIERKPTAVSAAAPSLLNALLVLQPEISRISPCVCRC